MTKASKPSKPPRDKRRNPVKSDATPPATVEDFDREGLGVAAKE